MYNSRSVILNINNLKFDWILRCIKKKISSIIVSYTYSITADYDYV